MRLSSIVVLLLAAVILAPAHLAWQGSAAFASASATRLWRMLFASIRISTGFLPGNALAHASTISRALSPNPAPRMPCRW
jgi:membrane protein implicated in regulation of membrane protease activity